MKTGIELVGEKPLENQYQSIKPKAAKPKNSEKESNLEKPEPKAVQQETPPDLGRYNRIRTKRGNERKSPRRGYKLQIPQDQKKPGYIQRWFNDYDDRPLENIQRAADSGYAVCYGEVKLDRDSEWGKQVGSAICRPVEPGVTAVLMEIPIEEWVKNQIDKSQQSLRRNQSLVDELKNDIPKDQYGSVYGSIEVDGKTYE